MTNFEWLKEEINKMNLKEFYTFKHSTSPWCKTSSCNSLCIECAEAWANQKYEIPMPKLKNGMFVEVGNCGFGVVVNDEIIFQNGAHDNIEFIKEYITKVFEATCFIDCEDDVGIIWERN